MNTEEVARMLAVVYWLGRQKGADIPTTVDDMMGHGHDGLNWQAFVALAQNILERARPKAFERGWQDCAQDGFENAPFGSIGGLDAREHPVRPPYITPNEWPAYLFGYSECARTAYGETWATATFGWSPALVIDTPK